MSETMNPPMSAADLLVQIRDKADQIDYNIALTPEFLKFYGERYLLKKEEIDGLAAEIHIRQDKMRLLNDLICEINNLTDANQGLDFSKNPELQEKLRLAKELGANINPEKLTFTSNERDRLIQNLHLKTDEWDKDNRTQLQKMDIFAKELDRILMMIKEVQKSEERPKRAATSGIKGG